MKKKVIIGIFSIGALALTSCGNNSDEKSSSKESASSSVSSTTTSGSTSASNVSSSSKSTTLGEKTKLQISINYNGEQGVSLRVNQFSNPVTGTNFTKGDILPTWTCFAEKTNTIVEEACDYSSKTIDNDFDMLQTNNFKSQTSNDTIDLLYANTKKINPAGSASKAVNLLEYLDDMPNFSSFLEENPSVESLITFDNGIYYTPYFDGMNYIEKMLIMDHNMVKTLLDNPSVDDFDIALSGKGGASNTLKEAKYQPFIDSTNNYASKTTEVEVSLSATENKKISISQTTNIIKQQNESLATGVSGKDLVIQFRNYLNEAFKTPLNDGTYTKLSDIFLSEQAAYNVDELIALMRIVKANPKALTGDSSAEIEILCPRGEANNRVDNIQDFLSVWGIQGVVGEKDMLYFDANGKLNDAASTPATYEALEYLTQIYDEGLIVENFSNNNSGSSNGNSNYYLSRYFAHTDSNKGYGFMMYDYNASTSAANKIDNYGIGVNADKLTNGATASTGIGPVVTPISYWASSKDYNYSQSLSNHTNKSLMRYTEDNRSLKGSAWMIPANSDNITGALKMMDIMFSQEGQWINNFGPDQYWVTSNIDEMDTYAGEKTPTLNEKTFKILEDSQDDMWSDMRGFIGATHGIGNVRPASMNYQGTSEYSKEASKNVDNAVASGAINLAKIDKVVNKKFDISVPSVGYESISNENAGKYDAVSGFWSTSLYGAVDYGWVLYVQRHDDNNKSFIDNGELKDTAVIGKGTTLKNDYTWADVKSQRYNERLSIYLYTMAQSLGSTLDNDYMPSYLA